MSGASGLTGSMSHGSRERGLGPAPANLKEAAVAQSQLRAGLEEGGPGGPGFKAGCKSGFLWKSLCLNCCQLVSSFFFFKSVYREL